MTKSEQAAYHADYKERRAMMVARDPSLVPHGTNNGYVNWSCRCRPCTDAHAAAHRAQRAAA